MCLGQEQTEVVTASARPNVQVRGSLRPRTLQLSEHGRLAQILPCAALQNTESPDAVSEAVGPYTGGMLQRAESFEIVGCVTSSLTLMKSKPLEQSRGIPVCFHLAKSRAERCSLVCPRPKRTHTHTACTLLSRHRIRDSIHQQKLCESMWVQLRTSSSCLRNICRRTALSPWQHGSFGGSRSARATSQRSASSTRHMSAAPSQLHGSDQSVGLSGLATHRNGRC